MAYITETAVWTTQIYQLETGDPVLGGVGGVSNQQPLELANRLARLKELLEQYGLFPVSGDFEFTGQNVITDVTFEGTVVNEDLVYWNDVASMYYKALADGTIASKVIGIADVTNARVVVNGLIQTSETYTSGDIVYLSSSSAGSLTNTTTSISVGRYVDDGVIFISPLGVGSGTGDIETIRELNMYQDLLDNSIYANITYNSFASIETDDPLIDNSSDMTFNASDGAFDFTSGQIMLSTDLIDPLESLTITNCMVSIDFDDTGSETIEVTADGTNWETVSNNTLHTFTNTGSDLRMKFTGGGTGTIYSWAMLYNATPKDIQAGESRKKYISFYNEGDAVDEETIIDGFVFDNRVLIEKITILAKTAPTDADITIDILKDSVEQTNISTLTALSNAEVTNIVNEFFETTETFGLMFKTIGSTLPGSKINIIIHYSDVAES